MYNFSQINLILQARNQLHQNDVLITSSQQRPRKSQIQLLLIMLLKQNIKKLVTAVQTLIFYVFRSLYQFLAKLFSDKEAIDSNSVSMSMKQENQSIDNSDVKNVSQHISCDDVPTKLDHKIDEGQITFVVILE